MTFLKGTDCYAYTTANAAVTFTGAGATIVCNQSSTIHGTTIVVGSDETTIQVTEQVTESVAETVGSALLGAITGGISTVVQTVTNTEPNLNPTAEPVNWTVAVNGNQVLNASILINPMSGGFASPGNVSQGGGTLSNAFNTPAVIQPGYAVSYGFYNSSSTGGLPANDQFYVYVTPNYSNWMGMYAAQLNNVPFNEFVLPGAHDSGMCAGATGELTNAIEVIGQTAKALIQFLVPEIPSLVLEGVEVLGVDEGIQATINVSFTQKETITTLLNLGVRFFDFRPGYNYWANGSGDLYHQHMVVPGYAYTSFLTDVLNWLAENKSEVVVLFLNFQGFQTTTMQPTSASLLSTLNQINNGRVNLGGPLSLNETYGQLINSNTRLILLNDTDSSDPYSASFANSYFNGNYVTANSQDVIAALEASNYHWVQQASPNANFVLLQLQGTAQGANGGENIAFNAISVTQCASPILSTKAAFDNATYPWILNNAHNNLDYVSPGVPAPSKRLLVMLNDFCDNALVDVCLHIMGQRTGNNNI